MAAPPASSLVGREVEIDVLEAALAGLEERRPRAVEIAGPAGIGKSRLLAELAARAEARGHVVLAGAGAELEQDLPFWVFVDALDDYVEGLDPRKLDRLDARVRSELAQVLPALDGDAVAGGAAIHERYRIHRAMRELLERLAATKPLVLILDDFHWADAASTDLLVALLHRPPAAGVLLAVAARPRQLAPRLAGALDRARRSGALTALELTALTADQARALVGDRADRIYADSGGNPFYLEQLARVPGAVADGEHLRLSGVQVPAAVVAALADELTLLDPAARLVLNGAAVAGDPFELDLAAVAADLPEPAVLEALDELARLEFVRATDLPRRFRFRHPIVRRALYEATPEGWRIGAHARVADALGGRGAPAAARAHHVERAGRHGDPAAVAVLREAGEETRHRAPDAAARWLAAALRLLPATAPASERVQLLLPMAQAQAATGRFDLSHATLLETLDLLPRDEVAQWVEVSTWCARVEHLLGHHETAQRRLLATLDAVPDEDSDEGLAVLVELALDGLNRMDYKSMRGWSERAMAVADRRGDPLLQAAGAAAAARGLAFSGAAAEAGPVCDRAAALVDALSDTELARRLDAIVHLAGGELYLHRFADASRHAERALAIGRETGQHQLFPVAFAILAMTSLFLGPLGEALDPLEGNVEAARLSRNAQTISWSLYGLGKVAIAAGDVQRGLAAAQEAVDVADDGKPSHHVAYAALTLVEAHLLTGKPERGVPLLERAAGGPDLPLIADSWRAYHLELVTRVRLALGDRAAARRAVELADESAAAVGLPLARSWADRAAAALALEEGAAAPAAQLALGSAAVADAAGGRMEAARSRALAGRALAQAGDRDGAVEALRRAAATFAEVGAERDRDAAERELRALGQRVRRRPPPAAAAADGVAGLTAREAEIARLIVDRRTNRQIAEELFLSPKTVETHIRNIFAKLGADSRVEVARIVERADRLAASSA
ncbi:MAG TPA: AAA family ATPase [Baekduia sp.]|uniref:helix-turn-helix transcriptional regulator n=1 Tax=Baekduia sp. TaxID=2600305 RepID=UPI002D7A1615|nr:AAA family ATPase [Baekduia sp.]HET6505363.1 AAA family ATPase [Baekduia sp.]